MLSTLSPPINFESASTKLILLSEAYPQTSVLRLIMQNMPLLSGNKKNQDSHVIPLPKIFAKA